MDRELLEWAAKAAGLTTTHKWNAERLEMSPPVMALVVHRDGELVSTGWDPLTDDGDCARLEAKVMVDIKWYPFSVVASASAYDCTEIYADHDRDRAKARRYASTRAAAEISKATAQKGVDHG